MPTGNAYRCGDNMNKRIFSVIKHPLFSVMCLGMFAFCVTGINAFHYPSYFDDEGIYMYRAWSFLTHGLLAPYTYWYDHAPLGWMIIAVWVKLTGGFFTFGMSMNSGRAFMIVLSVLSTLMVYQIVKITTKRNYLGIIAGLFFTASPLSVSFHRMVFLDNIMVTLILAAWLVLLTQKRLLWYVISGFLFGLSVLVKETAPFFFPAFLLLLLIQTDKRHRVYSLILWIFIAASVVSFYFLYALLQGEFFESGKFLGGTNPHVSLLWTLLWQGARTGGYFLSSASEFTYTLKHSWLATDALLIIAGSVATIVNLGVGIKRKEFLVAGLFALCYIFYLIRGGIVNDQYIIPLLAMFAINIAFCFEAIERVLKIKYFPVWFRFLPVSLFIFYALSFYLPRLSPYLIDETTAQQSAYEWIINNIPKNQVVAVDGYMLTDFFAKNNSNVYTSIGPQHYWELDEDPAIVKNIIHNDWTSISYVVLDTKMKQDLTLEGLTTVRKVVANSSLVAQFKNPSFQTGSFPIKQSYGHILIADSNPVSIYQLNNRSKIAMTTTWDFIRSHFFQSYGQIEDPITNTTSSQNQANAMLVAVWENKRADFDGIWSWTKDHMEYRRNDKLLSRTMVKKGKDWKLSDYNTDTMADEDAAFALLQAYQKWGDSKYYFSAAEMVDDIWKNEIVLINGKYYVTTGADSDTEEGYRVNTASCSPAAYRLFALYDSSHPWNLVADDCYDIFSKIQEANGFGKTIIINKNSGNIISIQNEPQQNADLKITKTIFQIKMDMYWWGVNSGKNVLHTFVKNNFIGNSFISNLGIANALSVTNAQEAQAFYAKNIDAKFHYQEGYWEARFDVDEQLAGYIGSALYSNQLPKLE